jgi:hypothetical protein
MIAIPCSNCNRMIDIDSGTLSIESTQVEPIKVTCYLMQRDIKLNNILSLFRDSHEVSRRGLKERIKQWWNDVNIL